MKNNRRKTVYASLLVLGAALMLAAAWFVGRPIVKFAGEPERFRVWVDSHGLAGRLIYVGTVIVQVVIALIPGEPFELLGGYAFGAVEGTLLCIIAAALGSMTVFFLVRRFGMRIIEVFFSREKIASLRFLRSDEKKDMIFFVIFMLPGTPKDLLCYFAGITDMKPLTWLLICSVGRIPAVVTSTVGGDAIGNRNYLFAAAVFVLTTAVSLTGVWVFKRLSKEKRERGSAADPEDGVTPEDENGTETKNRK